MTLSNSVSRLAITEISARSITMAIDSSSGLSIRIFTGGGQAFFRQISEFEFLCPAGRGQRQLRGRQEHHVTRNFETSQAGCAKFDELLRVGKYVAGGHYAGAADFT